MDCIAHRGFAGINPENTLAAVRDATTRIDAVEVDVRRCGSGELVVCHDATVDRTTDGTGEVADFTVEGLAALSVEGSGEGVPTLAAVLEVMPAGATLHAELKEAGLAADLESLAEGADPDVVVSSFLPDALRQVDDHPTALVTDAREEAVERAVALDCEYLHLQVERCTHSVVGAAHEAGLRVNPWTLTDPVETRRLVEMTVDGVIADFPSCCPGRV